MNAGASARVLNVLANDTDGSSGGGAVAVASVTPSLRGGAVAVAPPGAAPRYPAPPRDPGPRHVSHPRPP